MKEYHVTDEESNYIEYRDGKYIIEGRGTFYYKDNQLHRKDGPACEHCDGYNSWWLNGKRHRLDGPACEYENGRVLYFINGKEYSSKEAYDVAVTELYLKENGLDNYL